jgi:CubicO group peptidase (beta-lactamase class C family)
MNWIIDEFGNQLEQDVRDDNVNGSIAAAVVRKKEILWSQAFGASNPTGSRQADTDTIYRVGSVAKSFTAFLMMLLVQAGTIELDHPVEKYFPEIRELEGYSAGTMITFRQLASHTAGLSREPRLEKADEGPIEEWEQKVLQSIAKTSLEYAPGTRFSYSNIGYAILGVALSHAANEPFIQMIEEKICKPLGMDNTFFTVPDHKRKNLAQGIGGGPFGDEEIDLDGPAREHRGRGYKVPNGGLYSTPTDLAKFLMSNTGHANLLAKEYLEIMHARQTPETTYHCYGLGYELYQDPRIKLAGHSGGVLGYSANLVFEKEHQFGVILMRNYNWGITSWDFAPKILLRKLLDFEKTRDTDRV